MRIDFIKDEVTKLINKYDTNDIYEILHFLDIEIHYRKLGQDVLAKLTKNIFGDYCIMLSPNIDENEEAFILAHELGHFILHKNVNMQQFNTNAIDTHTETDANLFATHLLIKDDLLDDYKEYNYTLNQISLAEGIPLKYLKIKFKDYMITPILFS